METEELFLLYAGGSKKVLAEEDDFFQSVFEIFIFLYNVKGLIDIGFVVGFGLNKFIEVESISGQIISHGN